MTCLFADLSLAAARAAFPHHIPPSAHALRGNGCRERREQAQDRIAALTPQFRVRVAKQQPPIRNLYLQCCPAFVMRNASSIIIAGRRQTDEAFQSPQRRTYCRAFRLQVVASSRLWLSERSLRALLGRWD
jgi:hypothetical protein